MTKLYQESGFTLPEVLVSMGLGAILLTAVMGVFQVQTNAYNVQEQITEMVQTARAAMEMICREVRMAGYNPTGASFQGLPYQAGKLRIIADLRGKNEKDPSDGDTNDPHEDITYQYNPKKMCVTRNTGGGNQPFAENIAAFSVTCLNKQGNATTATSEIFQVKISMTARTSKPDHTLGSNGGYRYFTLTSLVTPVNLIVQSH